MEMMRNEKEKSLITTSWRQYDDDDLSAGVSDSSRNLCYLQQMSMLQGFSIKLYSFLSIMTAVATYYCFLLACVKYGRVVKFYHKIIIKKLVMTNEAHKLYKMLNQHEFH